MNPVLESFLGILDLEQIELNIFRGQNRPLGRTRVYGGQVLGQALMAAIRTVEPSRSVHSLHGYFILGGDPSHPIDYQVERLRDGKSFSTRTVKAMQHGRVIFVMSASFQKPETGLEHQAEMPDVPAPEELASAKDLFKGMVEKLPLNMRKYWTREQPIDMRPVDISRYFSREPREPNQAIWLKFGSKLDDDPAIHRCVLAYASDFTLLDTALIAHGKLLFDPDIQLASLDHALWFHRNLRVDQWLLYSFDSPNASGARGFARGQFFTEDGRLVASTAQEGLVRLLSEDRAKTRRSDPKNQS